MYGLTCGIEVEEGRLHVKHFHCQMETSGQNECKLLISAALSWPVFKNMCTHTHTHTHTHRTHSHTHSTLTHTAHSHTHTQYTHTQHTHTHTHTHSTLTHTAHSHTHTHTAHSHTHTLTHSLYQTALGKACPRSSRYLEFLGSAGERKMMNRATCSLSLSIVYSPL